MSVHHHHEQGASNIFTSTSRSCRFSSASTWPIKLVLLFYCICCFGNGLALASSIDSPSTSGDLVSNGPGASPPSEGEELVNYSSEVDCLTSEDCYPSAVQRNNNNIHGNPQLLPQLVQRYLRELDSTGSAAFAVPRFTGSTGTVFKSVPYPIAQLLLARLRNGGLRGAAEVSAEPMLALTPIRKQRGNQLKMANRFGKRDRLRMSNRFGR